MFFTGVTQCVVLLVICLSVIMCMFLGMGVDGINKNIRAVLNGSETAVDTILYFTLFLFYCLFASVFIVLGVCSLYDLMLMLFGIY